MNDKGREWGRGGQNDEKFEEMKGDMTRTWNQRKEENKFWSPLPPGARYHPLSALAVINPIQIFPCHLYWRRQWQPTPVLLPGKSHGWRSLVGCSPWGREESDTTEWLHFHFSLSCSGEGNGNPLQNSCLENPRDGGAWWAAVYGVAQSRTRLKRLSSSSSSSRG